MSNAIADMRNREYFERLMRLADAQVAFVDRYTKLLADDDDKYALRRELNYLIMLTYREAQEPLTKQLTEFLMTQSRPIIIEKK
jgi:hypothetical protein